jgi:hypothetical protein
MPSRLKKLLGAVLLVLFVAAYVLSAMTVAVAVLPHGGRLAEFGFYAIAGLLWVVPAGLIIRWMHRP